MYCGESLAEWRSDSIGRSSPHDALGLLAPTGSRGVLFLFIANLMDLTIWPDLTCVQVGFFLSVCVVNVITVEPLLFIVS